MGQKILLMGSLSIKYKSLILSILPIPEISAYALHVNDVFELFSEHNFSRHFDAFDLNKAS